MFSIKSPNHQIYVYIFLYVQLSSAVTTITTELAIHMYIYIYIYIYMVQFTVFGFFLCIVCVIIKFMVYLWNRKLFEVFFFENLAAPKLIHFIMVLFVHCLTTYLASSTGQLQLHNSSKTQFLNVRCFCECCFFSWIYPTGLPFICHHKLLIMF